MRRKGIVALGMFMASIVIAYAGLLWNNNRSVPAPSRTEIDSRWENGVSWLVRHRETVLDNQNPILWWMVGESARISGDERLRDLFNAHRKQSDSSSVWLVAFYAPERVRNIPIPLEFYRQFPDYQQYFLFALSCNPQLSHDPLIMAQHETDFCRREHPLIPACVTHQLMGFRFAQRQGCAGIDALPEKIDSLQHRIAAQLTWDPRVVDVYVQRVLMLEESGAGHYIKPRWLRRILAAQQEDGGWTALQPLVALGGGRYIVFNNRLIGVGRPAEDFHMTVQSIWLLSLLRAQ